MIDYKGISIQEATIEKYPDKFSIINSGTVYAITELSSVSIPEDCRNLQWEGFIRSNLTGCAECVVWRSAPAPDAGILKDFSLTL